MSLRPHDLTRHGASFLGSGLIALAVDMGVLSGLTRMFGVSALAARPFAIGCAMIVGWLCQRTFTFAVAAAPSLAEFLRYVTVASGAAAINFALYSAILLAVPSLAPEAALAASSTIAMVVAYIGLRFGVFRQP